MIKKKSENSETVIKKRFFQFNGLNNKGDLRSLIDIGNYDFIDKRIYEVDFSINSFDEDFSISVVDISQCFTNGIVSVNDVTKKAEEKGWKLEEIKELLALGANYPEIQRQYAIVSLGSVVEFKGIKLAPCLYGNEQERGISLISLLNCWNLADRIIIS